jgi:ferritin-like metal-binding protein YciE
MPAPQQQTKPKAKAKAKQTPEIGELLATELREIYSAEKQLSRALPKIMKTVESDGVKQHIETRVERGERLVQELERGLESLGESPGRKKNVVAEALIADIQEHIQEIDRGPALDAILIGALQKTEHYCIAAWGTARAMAEEIGEDEIVQSMQRGIDEGKEMDQELTRLAEEEVMPMLSGDDEMDEEDEMADGARR